MNKPSYINVNADGTITVSADIPIQIQNGRILVPRKGAEQWRESFGYTWTQRTKMKDKPLYRLVNG